MRLAFIKLSRLAMTLADFFAHQVEEHNYSRQEEELLDILLQPRHR